MELKATTAREVSKNDVINAGAMSLNGNPVDQKPGMSWGEFYFRPTLIQHTDVPSWWSRFFVRQKSHIWYSTVDTIVISCPVDGLPILTSPIHVVLKHKPLTIDKPIACPYAPPGFPGSHSFSIKDGNIMLV